MIQQFKASRNIIFNSYRTESNSINRIEYSFAIFLKYSFDGTRTFMQNNSCLSIGEQGLYAIDYTNCRITEVPYDSIWHKMNRLKFLYQRLGLIIQGGISKCSMRNIFKNGNAESYAALIVVCDILDSLIDIRIVPTNPFP